MVVELTYNLFLPGLLVAKLKQTWGLKCIIICKGCGQWNGFNLRVCVLSLSELAVLFSYNMVSNF